MFIVTVAQNNTITFRPHPVCQHLTATLFLITHEKFRHFLDPIITNFSSSELVIQSMTFEHEDSVSMTFSDF